MCLAYPARVVRLDGPAAVVTVRGREQLVPLVVLAEPVVVDDWLLVQSGLAIGRIDAGEAADRIRMLDQVQGGQS
jgi:hydrogenase assembly chaperone HypC/HupF